jgi:DEAD/DEAH box helicase domain-containing protein
MGVARCPAKTVSVLTGPAFSPKSVGISEVVSGEMDGVISTSALEMGIDVGGLDLCLLVDTPEPLSIPGSEAAEWDGPDGWRDCHACRNDALDQYFLRNPRDFSNAPAKRPFGPF